MIKKILFTAVLIFSFIGCSNTNISNTQISATQDLSAFTEADNLEIASLFSEIFLTLNSLR